MSDDALKASLRRHKDEESVDSPSAALFSRKSSEQTKVQTNMPKELYRDLRVKAAVENTTLRQLMLDAVITAYPDLPCLKHD